MDRFSQEFGIFVEGLRAKGIATEVRGCSLGEIHQLEQTLGCTLPLVYRLYLETMGHSAGRLFTHDHLAVTYEHVLELRGVLVCGMSDSPSSGAPAFSLPERAAVIAGRLGEQFFYIVCDQPDDTPVFYVSIWDQEPKRAYPGVMAWLREQEAEALEAIQSGYCDRHPNGTIP